MYIAVFSSKPIGSLGAPERHEPMLISAANDQEARVRFWDNVLPLYATREHLHLIALTKSA